jgi:phage host-nuclease inhibitor protein Gam
MTTPQKKTTAARALLARIQGEPIANRDELAAVAITTARLTIERDQAILERDEALARVKEEYALRIEEHDTEIEKQTRRMARWANENREEFGKAKTLLVAGHELAWRKSPGKVETVKGVKEADAVEALLSTLDDEQQEKLLSLKVGLDKRAILAAWETNPEARAILAAAGLEVVAPEEFTFRPDREKIDSAPVKVGAE